MRRIQTRTGLMFAIAAVATAALAAPPNVPTSLPYQGLLLDGLGEPRTGSVDLTVRVWDAVVGGTLVYKQSFPAVALADGVFTVQLGPTGEGTDAPSNPLTTALSTALAGDVGITAPVRFLEVTVGGDGALSRTQILASAYAVRAASADTATTATTATNATNVSGVSGLYTSEFFENFNADGGGPANFDPSEGVVDVDGDGILNFIDADNDADALSDIAEVAQGSDINLVTPNVTGASPPTGYYASTTNVTVNGSGFQPGLAVSFGTQAPTPSNVTSTSFQVSVGPQNPGPASVLVGNPNGQSDVLAGAFTFQQTVAHSLTSVVGLDVRDATTEVVIGSAQLYGVGDATVGLTVYPLASKNSGRLATAFDSTERVSGLRCRDLGSSCSVELLVDADADSALEDETGIAIETVGGTAARLEAASLGTDASGRWVAGYVRKSATTIASIVAHDQSGDGDFADAGELVTVQSGLGDFGALQSALAIDSASRVAWVKGLIGIDVAWDRNGDGDFADTIGGNPELFGIGATSSCFGATFDSADRLAVVYNNGAGAAILVRDLNADGDFADVGESTTLVAAGGIYCDVAWRAGQPFTVAHWNSGTIALKMDKNDDGDFADAGEASSISSSVSSGLRLRLNGTTSAVLGFSGAMAVGSTN